MTKDQIEKIKSFAENVKGYWTTSNECLPDENECDEVIKILQEIDNAR